MLQAYLKARKLARKPRTSVKEGVAMLGLGACAFTFLAFLTRAYELADGKNHREVLL